MHAEIVMIGTELLLGEIVDTNANRLALALRDIGLDLYYKTTVGDNLARITEVLDLALDRSDIIITSGGIGPTVDDVTRQAVADATGVNWYTARNWRRRLRHVSAVSVVRWRTTTSAKPTSPKGQRR